MVCNTPSSQDASTHQIWNSCLKEYRRYEPDLMPILETRSEVKVTRTRKWYMTLLHQHTKFGIPTSNNIRDMIWTQLFYELGQGHSDPKMVRYTPSSPDTFTHQTRNSYLKEYGTQHSVIPRCIHTPGYFKCKKHAMDKIFFKLGQGQSEQK